MANADIKAFKPKPWFATSSQQVRNLFEGDHKNNSYFSKDMSMQEILLLDLMMDFYPEEVDAMPAEVFYEDDGKGISRYLWNLLKGELLEKHSTQKSEKYWSKIYPLLKSQDAYDFFHSDDIQKSGLKYNAASRKKIIRKRR